MNSDSDGKESACRAGDPGLIPGSGRSPGEGHASPLQYSCLENPMDRGARWATVHGVTQSRTWMSDWHNSQYIIIIILAINKDVVLKRVQTWCPFKTSGWESLSWQWGIHLPGKEGRFDPCSSWEGFQLELEIYRQREYGTFSSVGHQNPVEYIWQELKEKRVKNIPL